MTECLTFVLLLFNFNQYLCIFLSGSCPCTVRLNYLDYLILTTIVTKDRKRVYENGF